MATVLGAGHTTIAHLRQILFQNDTVTLDEQALQGVRTCYKFLRDFSQDKLIYGINTGFGPMAQYRITEADQTQLQYNLIRSHASGLGKPLDPTYVKALMLARLNSFLQGHSGVHPETLDLLLGFINNDIAPAVYEHGGVGASGDLVQLAHLALCLIGEGRVQHNGEWKATDVAMAQHGLQPLTIHLREGLALINGTSCMTGIGVVNVLHAQNLLNWSIVASSFIVEMVRSYDDHYSEELNNVKQHPGQRYIAAKMRHLLRKSTLTRKRQEHLYDQKVTDTVLVDKVQEYYSIRCVPQILGPIYDTLMETIKVVMNEFNSVNDNPVIDPKTQNVYHGGNFHGDYVSLAMDKLKVATTRLSMLTERQLNFLLNDKLNQILPPFVNLGTLGLNLGMQGSQFVATSTTAESQTLSFPMYAHSIPNNNDNQDIVSMGTNSALLTAKVIENTYQVMAVHLLTLVQAVDALALADQLTPALRSIYTDLRTLVPTFTSDTVMHEKLTQVVQHIRTHQLLFEAPGALSSASAETSRTTQLA